MTQQMQGDRAGQPWPPPGEEIDLPDDEAQGLIDGGTAVKPDHTEGKVLVPPAGVHTPGNVLHDDATTAMVEAPADAVRDPAGTRQAAADAAQGNTTQVSRDGGYQHADGSALTVDEHEQRQTDDNTPQSSTDSKASLPAALAKQPKDDTATKSAG
jgi:hypothetical protein